MIRPPDDCGTPQSWPRSPSERRGCWGGLCTQQAQRGLHPAPVAEFECPAVHVVSTATSSTHEGQPTTAPRHRRHPRPCYRLIHRCRWQMEAAQPSWPIRVRRRRASGRCAVSRRAPLQRAPRRGHGKGAGGPGVGRIPCSWCWRPHHRWWRQRRGAHQWIA